MSFLTRGSKLIKSAAVLNKSIIITPAKHFSGSLARFNEYEYKAELTVKQMNNDNPFDTYVMKPEPGRGLMKKTPILIPSMSDSRWVLRLSLLERILFTGRYDLHTTYQYMASIGW